MIAFLKKNWWWLALAALFLAWWFYNKKVINPGDFVEYLADKGNNAIFKKGERYQVLEVTKNANGETIYTIAVGDIKGQVPASEVQKS